MGLLAQAPDRVSGVLREIRRNPQLNPGVLELRERRREFSSPSATLLAGVAAHADSRDYYERALDEHFASTKFRRRAIAEEVIIGGGLHAAIYSAMRVAQGYAKPVVLERSDRVGGTFATSRGPSFYLNSRNRPGPPGAPGEGAQLNWLPGSPVQPADLSGAEFQRNNDLAFAIRTMLALYATVLTDCPVGEVDKLDELTYVVRTRDRDIKARRVIDARGLGDPDASVLTDGTARALTFPQLMARMDDPFPLRGLRNVAVIGAGDSGKTAIEALVGQSPSQHHSMASLDWVERIDWYDRSMGFASSQQFCELNRPRYHQLGALLPNNTDRKPRVRLFSGGTTRVGSNYQGAVVAQRQYDLAVVCCGYERPELPGMDLTDKYNIDQTRNLGKWANGTELYAVGPAAGLEVNAYENKQILNERKENQVALFRYAARTATLATVLSAPLPF